MDLLCVCKRDREGGQSFGGVHLWGLCVCVWAEVVCTGQAIIIRDSLRVGSESKIIWALKICRISTIRRTCNIVTFLYNSLS